MAVSGYTIMLRGICCRLEIRVKRTGYINGDYEITGTNNIVLVFVFSECNVSDNSGLGLEFCF